MMSYLRLDFEKPEENLYHRGDKHAGYRSDMIKLPECVKSDLMQNLIINKKWLLIIKMKQLIDVVLEQGPIFLPHPLLSLFPLMLCLGLIPPTV